jgi:hypothetical protein
MRWLVASCLVATLASQAHAGDLSCWGSPDVLTADRTCVPLTASFLRSLRVASRDDVQRAMGVTGEEDESGELTFTSNYVGGGPGAGTVQVRFGEGGLVQAIDASVVGENKARELRFLWTSSDDGVGCSDLPGSSQVCNP